MTALLAHQGGWDEILLVLGPILLIAGLLSLAKKRVERAAAQQAADRDPQAADGNTPG
jgi:hypothetical protein